MCIRLLHLISAFFMTRMLFVTWGLLKGPILIHFERYGDAEARYSPLPALLFWIGLFMQLSGIYMEAVVTGAFYSLETLGLLCLLGAYLTYRMPGLTRRLFPFPRWYVDLWSRTSRSERRRIAFMWLRISWKARMRYNSNDRAFLEWADYIILSTLYL